MSTYDEIRTWHGERTLARVKENLEKRGFTAVVLQRKEDIVNHLLDLIPKEAVVGFGGSVSTRELGIVDRLRERGNIILDHWSPGITPAEALVIRKKQLTADFFLTGCNALTLDGRMVNIDGTGNRVASAIFGPSHIIAVIGANKITRDLDDALWRIKNVATPQNTRRLGVKTPCANLGYCTDCGPATSICRVTTILDYRPPLAPYTVILTPVNLGF